MIIRTITEFIKPDELMMFNRDDLFVPSQLHSHEFVEIEYVLSGTGVQTINGTEYNIRRGDVIVLEPGSQHAYHSIDNLVVFNCIIHPTIYEREKARILAAEPEHDQFFLPEFIRLTGHYFIEVENILLTSELEFEKTLPGYKLICENNLSSLLLYLYRNAWYFAGDKNDDIKKNIIEYIDVNYAHLSLTDIADRFGYSPSYFSKLFKKIMGENMFDYVQRKKMEECVRLIITTNYSITSICRQLGYNDKKQFYKMFKSKTGQTPEQFRRSHCGRGKE